MIYVALLIFDDMFFTSYVIGVTHPRAPRALCYKWIAPEE